MIRPRRLGSGRLKGLAIIDPFALDHNGRHRGDRVRGREERWRGWNSSAAKEEKIEMPMVKNRRCDSSPEGLSAGSSNSIPREGASSSGLEQKKDKRAVLRSQICRLKGRWALWAFELHEDHCHCLRPLGSSVRTKEPRSWWGLQQWGEAFHSPFVTEADVNNPCLPNLAI